MTALDADACARGVLAGDRTTLAQAITLVESSRDDHAATAREVLAKVLPATGSACRVGVTGVPGVGKSTFLDQFGSNLTAAGHRVAVLAVDPSSQRTGGSILGDKTRMARLANDPAAFVRPSPAGRTLGGVTRTTRETMLLCEAAGYDVVMVETVGVGQSETIVADMVDFFLVLTLAGAGDDLQGIKRGVLELADLIAVNKADGDNRRRAEISAADHRMAVHLMQPASAVWSTPVLTCSGAFNEGLEEIWGHVQRHREVMSATGQLAERRRRQQLRWMWAMVDERLRDGLRRDPAVARVLPRVVHAVEAGEMTAGAAADEVLRAFGMERH